MRNRPGQYQRPVVSSFHGGVYSWKPAFRVSCCAKAMIHGSTGGGSQKAATLLVYEFRFISQRGARIKAANISFEFKADSKSRPASTPIVAKVRPYGVLKMEETVRNEVSKLGISMSIGPSVPGVDASLTPSKERVVAQDVKYHTIVTGDNPPDEDFGDRFLASFTLQENKAQESGIPAEFTVAILLERDSHGDFIMVPRIEATPDLATRMVSLVSSRTPDDPVYFRVDSEPFNELGGEVQIDKHDLRSADMEALWDCTLYNKYGEAVKMAKRL